MDLSPLNRFIGRVEKLQKDKVERAAIEMSRAVSLTISFYVKEYFPDASVTVFSVNQETNTISCIININAEDLWFREYGTGYKGMANSAWEYMPTVDLSFFSRGQTQHTKGWEYAYHPKTKEEGGWWFLDPNTGKYTFTEGEYGKHGVTNTILRIKYHGLPELAEFVRMYLR